MNISMSLLNLLPPTVKENVRLMRLYIVLKNSIIGLLMIAIFVATVLLIAKVILQNTFNEIVAQTTITNTVDRVFNKDITRFNNRLTALEEAQKKFAPHSQTLAKVFAQIPSNIVLSDISIVDNKLFIIGNAATRDNLLAFQSAIDSLEFIDELTIPLEFLLSREDINFTAQATLISSSNSI